MKALLFNFLFLISFAFADATVDTEIVQLIKSISQNQQSTVNSKGCDFQKEKWLELLISQKSFQGKIEFNKNCDFNGTYQPVMADFFPLDFAIRNHPHIKNFKGKMKLSLQFTHAMILMVEFNSAEVSGQKNAIFDGYYAFEVDPLNSKNFIQKNLGGEIKLKSINSKNINKTIKIPAS